MAAERSRTTCCPLFYDALRSYAGNDPDKVRLFAGGFIHGQAEKVFIGACPAAMFRAPEEHRAVVYDLVQDAARHYGLLIRVLECQNGRELWLCRHPEYAIQISELLAAVENSSEWHTRRARLCGVDPDEVDPKFHERQGYAPSGA